MSDSIQPTGSQNSQNAAVENQSVGQFGNQVIAKKDDACIKGLHEKVRCGFSLGQGIARAWHVVKEGVSTFFSGIGAFFKKHFGEQSGAVSTVQVQVGTGNVSAGETSISVGVRQSVASRVPSPSGEIPEKPSDTLGSDFSKVSNKKTASETPLTQSTASVKKNVSSSSPKYRLVDVPGNGNCGIYAVLVGIGVLDSSEFRKPTHPDQGSHPLANAVQEQKVGELRKKSAEIAHKALGSRYSLEELKNMNEKKLSNKEKKIKNLLEMGSSVSEDNMKFVTEAIQKPIMVHVFQGNFCSKTLFEVGKDGQYWDNVYGNEVYPEIKASEDTIHLYLSNGHYQLMSPIKAP